MEDEAEIVAQRLTAAQRAGLLTEIGCPDCRGVLAVEELGDEGHLRFSCQIGHQFSQESLLGAKEDQVETMLWNSIETYEEVRLLYGFLSTRAKPGAIPDGEALQRRAQRAQHLSKTLQEVLKQDGPPELQPK